MGTWESHGSSDGVREWNPSMEVLAFLLAIQVKIRVYKEFLLASGASGGAGVLACYWET